MEILSFFTDGLSKSEILALAFGGIFALVGLIFCFIRSKLKIGLFAILSAVLYTIAFFVTINEYKFNVTIPVMIIMAIIFNIITWGVVSVFSFGEVLKAFGIGLVACVLFASAVLPAVVGLLKEMIHIEGPTQWLTLILVVSLIVQIAALCASEKNGSAGGSYSTNLTYTDDAINSMTGDEDIVDTTLMS